MGGRRDLHRVNAIAARQDRLVTRPQVLGAGVTPRVLDGLVSSGWLHRVHTGVYSVGPPAADPRVAWLAATLAVESAVLSDRSAAELWGLLTPRRPVHVTVATHAGLAGRDGIVVHRRRLRPDEWTRRADVPCTTLARTLLDVAASERSVLPRAFEEAQVRHHLRPALLAAATLERPGHRGVRVVRALLTDAVDPGEIESVLELRFLAFCARWGLPRPLTQVQFRSWRADFFLAEHGVVIETDGGRFHASAAKRARDRRKTAALEALGLVVLRVTWHELHERPAELAGRVRDALSVASSPATGDRTTFGGR